MRIIKKVSKLIVLFSLSISLTLVSLPLKINKASAAYRTITITDYWTSGWANRADDVNPPSTLKGEYYDSVSGEWVPYTLHKTGGLYSVDSRTTYIYHHSPGAAPWYDKETNYYLGFMSNNPYTYYAGRYDDPKPGEAPDRYYGIPLEIVDNDWELIDYGWDEPNPVNADEWASRGNASRLVYSGGSYWWRSEKGVLNKYRKGVWIDYRLKVKQYKYRQKYTATITLPDNLPPEHISHSMTYTYRNGNDYWVQPNTNVTITLRQRDPESGNKYQYLRLLGNGQDVRARHDFSGSSSNMNSVGSYPTSTNHLSINSASRTENTQYGTVQWKVTPKTHGHAYSVLYHYVDNANNAYGYDTGAGNTGMKLRVDGVSPSLNQYTFSGARYVNGSTYWVRSGDSLDITIRQYDGDSGNKYQYLRALDPDGNIVSRSRHDFAGSKSSNNKQITNSNFDIVSANRTENTAYGKIEWTVKPKTHNSSYTVQTYLQDNVNNYRDYTTLGTVKVDDIAPVLNSFQLTGAQYIDGNNYWVQPNRTVKVKIRQYDDASGNKHQYLRLLENGEIVVRSRHDFGSSPDTNIKQVENTNVSIDSAYRSENSAYGTVEWSIRPISHGHNYEVQRYFIDYVSNSRDYVTDGYLRVDGVGPNIYFRNQSDTSDFTGRDWADEDIVVRLKFSDAHSGYKRSRYAWSLSPNTPSESEWSNWTTSSNYLVSQAMKGEWYLHVQAEDFVGNRTTTKSSVYKLNHPPEVILQYEVLPPNPGNGEIFEGDTIKVCVQVHDEDGDLLTVKSYYEKDGKKNYLIEEGGVASGTKLCNTFVADTPGQYNIGASANDGIFQSSASTWINVKSLILKGFVLHTDEWNLFHQQMGHAFNMFYSGEKFMLAANVSPYPIVYVKSTLVANQADGKPINDSVELYKHSNVLYRGELYHEKYTKYPTNIKKGPANFVFEVKYQNGKVKNDTVPIIIIDDVYKPFKFHRKY